MQFRICASLVALVLILVAFPYKRHGAYQRFEYA
jgi:hypothetical protein